MVNVTYAMPVSSSAMSKGVQPPKPMMHIAYSSYFKFFYIFLIPAKFINVPYFHLNLRFLLSLRFCFPLMHLRIMLYTYFAPLDS